MRPSPPGKDSHLHLTPCLRHQVTAAAVRGQQRQNAVHLFAARFIIINIRVVIKGKTLIKYSCAGEQGFSRSRRDSYIHWGLLEASGPPRGLPEKVPDYLLWSESFTVSQLILSDNIFFLTLLFPRGCFESCPHSLAASWTALHLFNCSLSLPGSPLQGDIQGRGQLDKLPIQQAVEKWSRSRGFDISSLLLCTWLPHPHALRLQRVVRRFQPGPLTL